MPLFVNAKVSFCTTGIFTAVTFEGLFIDMPPFVNAKVSLHSARIFSGHIWMALLRDVVSARAFQPKFRPAFKIGVSPLMSDKVELLLTGIIANIAFIGSCVRVSQLMCNEMVLSFAGIIAFATFEWLYTRMYSFMLLQIEHFVAAKIAFRAFVAFFDANRMIAFFVPPNMRLSVKFDLAKATLKRLFSSMRSFMVF